MEVKMKVKNPDNDKTQIYSGVTGVCGLLGVAFVVLKLIGIIEWSWLWVTAPFWIPFAFILSILILYLLFMVIAFVFTFIIACISDSNSKRIGKKARKEYIDKGLIVKRKDGTYGTKEYKDD